MYVWMSRKHEKFILHFGHMKFESAHAEIELTMDEIEAIYSDNQKWKTLKQRIIRLLDVNLDGQNNTCEWVLKFSDGYVVRIYDYGVDRGTVHGKTDRSGMHWHLLSVPDIPQGYQNFWDLFKDENV